MALTARTGRGRSAFGIGWAFGVGHFTIGLNWIATAFTYQAAMPAWLGWIAVVLLALYLAVYPALAAWGAWTLRLLAGPTALRRAKGSPSALPFARMSLSYFLSFAALWTLTEWLRSWVFTGFAWNPLAAITMSGDFAGILGADYLAFIGTYGVSAIVILWAGFVAAAVEESAILRAFKRRNIPDPRLKSDLAGEPLEEFDGKRFAKVLGVAAVAAVILIMTGFLGASNAPYESRLRPAAQITVVQPNVGQQDKWEGSKADANFAKLARLTAPKDDRPRLILWPEAAVPDYLETGYPAVYYDRSPAAARGRLTDLMNPDDVMLLGALKLEFDKTGDAVGARNAVMTVHADGTLGPRYDKSHLVPYGEYLPMRPVLSALGLSRLAPGDIDFWPGPGPRTLALPEVREAPLPPDAPKEDEIIRQHYSMGRPALNVGLQICYEIIFSGQVVDRAHRPDFIFNPSNDAWFGGWGPPQHLAQARLRRIAEGVPVVPASPTRRIPASDAH
ncbi:MAG: apolipoprotein N-acyltransferase, partial [Sphingopyxis sp.]|nr:apolipoprotein N-acyltransferase [Sphingopyxis sp.]